MMDFIIFTNKLKWSAETITSFIYKESAFNADVLFATKLQQYVLGLMF